MSNIYTYAAILSHPDQPEYGHMAHVEATDAATAVDALWDAVDSEDNIYQGYDFTIWPAPCN